MPPIGPEHAHRAATIARCLHVLKHGIVRARFMTGCRWPSAEATPDLPGPDREALGELLDALHNLPEYLAELIGDTGTSIPEAVIESAFRAFDELYARTDPRFASWTSSSAEKRADGGNAGELDHEK